MENIPSNTLTSENSIKGLEETKVSDVNRLKRRKIVQIEHVVITKRESTDLNGLELGTVLNLEYTCSLMTKENDITILRQSERPSSNNKVFQFMQSVQIEIPLLRLPVLFCLLFISINSFFQHKLLIIGPYHRAY